jgi:hypothetical protein
MTMCIMNFPCLYFRLNIFVVYVVMKSDYISNLFITDNDTQNDLFPWSINTTFACFKT